MKEKVENLKLEVAKKLESTTCLKEVNDIKVEYLGKKGPVQELTSHMKDLSSDEKQIKNAHEQYTSALEFAARLLEYGYIDEMEYNKKKLSAIQSLINSYETNGDVSVLSTQTYKDLIEQQKSLIKTLSEQEKESEKAKEDARAHLEEGKTAVSDLSTMGYDATTFGYLLDYLERRMNR